MNINLIDKISFKEREMILDYINTYIGYSEKKQKRRANFETLFYNWNNAKQDLYKLLGNNLIIEKSFSFNQKDFLKEEINNLLSKSSFYKSYRQIIYNYWECHNFSYLENVLNKKDLLSGYYTGETFTFKTLDNKEIEIKKGKKIMKIIKEMSDFFNIPNFEDFRIEHSKILNKKTRNEKITLSIHPLDYMTMSDNSCNWSSCMSWADNGCYRQGTVEMMNSPYVIVAYTNSSKPYHLGLKDKDYEWSNKKWRCLFIVADNKIIIKIKSYPYENEILEKAVVNWIADLFKENLGIKFDEEIFSWNGNDNFVHIPYLNSRIYLSFDTNYMYNDFGKHTTHFFKLNSSNLIFKDDISFIDINYSGESQCMWCGNPLYCEEEEEDLLICDDCKIDTYCYNCGTPIEENICLDSFRNIYCNICYKTHTRKEDLSGYRVNSDELIDLYIVPSCEIIKDICKKNNLSSDSSSLKLSDYLSKYGCKSISIRESVVSNNYFFNDSFFIKYFSFEDIKCIRELWKKYYFIDCHALAKIFPVDEEKQSKIAENLIKNSKELETSEFFLDILV